VERGVPDAFISDLPLEHIERPFHHSEWCQSLTNNKQPTESSSRPESP
jgi:hypothetical protein